MISLARIRVRVRILSRKGIRGVSFPARKKIRDLLEELGYSSQTVITRRNGKIVVEGERLTSGDFIEVIPVVTGG